MWVIRASSGFGVKFQYGSFNMGLDLWFTPAYGTYCGEWNIDQHPSGLLGAVLRPGDVRGKSFASVTGAHATTCRHTHSHVTGR